MPVLPESRRAVAPVDEAIAAAVRVLHEGGLVGLPTETVYGLAALAHDHEAVARIFSVKGRPADHPLIVHIADVSQLSEWAASVPTYAVRLAEELWPGPLTLILPKQPQVSALLTGGQDTVGLRVPSHPTAQQVIRAAGAVAAPSANRFGRVSPTTAHAVAEELADFLDERDLILDGGACAVGIESTIVDCTGSAPRILRDGFYGDEVISRTAGIAVDEKDWTSTPRVSGSLAAHYAPQTPVRLLDATQVNQLDPSELAEVWLLASADESILGAALAAAAHVTRPPDASAYAQLLYATLREADTQQVTAVFAVPPLGQGISVAIRDRLQRAAAGSAAGENR